MQRYKPVVLVVLDGWGEWNVTIGNPLMVAKMPTMQTLNHFYPKLVLEASGLSVGLPWGVMGNSEVGHQTLGAGQIVFEASPTIDMAIQSGEFFNNPALKNVMKYTSERQARLHIIGLVSDGGVHSKIGHLFALLEMARRAKLADVCVHALTDGRDTPPQSAREYIVKLVSALSTLGVGRIASIGGRFWGMDRNRNWARMEKAAAAIISGQGRVAKDPVGIVEEQYRGMVHDEFFEPTAVVGSDDRPVGAIRDGDAVICFNFRGDRARQLARVLTDPGFKEFKQVRPPKDIRFVGFTEYEKELKAEVAFPARRITTRVGEILSGAGKKQLRIAETEKYAHVTYFFNGGWEEPFQNEERILIPSQNAPTYASVPEMSAAGITDRVLAEIGRDKYDFILVNYANPDMVGHTGVFAAGVKAVEHVDLCLARLIPGVLGRGGCLIVTADHGNIEEMINTDTGEPDTKHSANPVPCWLATPDNQRTTPVPPALLSASIDGMLSDVSATVLELSGLDRPPDMTGRSLIPLFEVKP